MKKLAALILITIFFTALGCGGDRDEQRPAENTEPVESPEPSSQSRNITNNSDTDGARRNIPPLEKIKAVTVKTVSDTPRDGFQAFVEIDGPPGTSTIDFRYEWKVNGKTVSGVTGDTLTWREGFKKGDTVTVTVTPFGEYGEGLWVAEGDFSIPNSPPEITSQPETSFNNGNFTYTVEASDPDGDEISYTLKNAPKGMTIEPATGFISWSYGEEDAGEHVIIILVTDSEGAATMQELTLSIDSSV